jgi:hypothetical protein
MLNFPYRIVRQNLDSLVHQREAEVVTKVAPDVVVSAAVVSGAVWALAVEVEGAAKSTSPTFVSIHFLCKLVVRHHVDFDF